MKDFVADITAIIVVKRIFVLAVMAIAILPRMPYDEPISIGGDLSKGFRQLLLFIGLLHFGRNSLQYIISPKSLFSLALQAFESDLIVLLSLLTPYLLRTWMSERINFPGAHQKGKGLMPWLYTITCLAFLGAVLPSIYGDNKLWIFKKIADALSFIPVYRTMIIYNGMTTVGGRYAGRGSVLAQVIIIAEFYALLSHMTEIIESWVHLIGMVQSDFESQFSKGLHTNNHVANWTRVLCHSILLNVLDETYHCHTATTADDDEPPTPTSSSSSNRGRQDSEVAPLARV